MSKNQEGVVHLFVVVLIVVVVAAIAYLLFTGKGGKLPLGQKKEPEVQLQTQYQNPFAKEAQYVNPFSQSKNQFDNLIKR